MPKPKKSIVILGIDPGLADTGFGLIKKTENRLEMVDFGTIKTKADVPTEKRLMDIHQSLVEIIKKYRPSIIAVEKLFFAKNVKTALAVGQARGVVMLTAGEHKLIIKEYTPLQVKTALTSYGRASKKQIQEMVKVVLKLDKAPRSDDAADALATAICCVNSLVKHG